MAQSKHDPLRELAEIRNQLSYTKRIGFLFGAGTSKAMGIPDIKELTDNVEGSLDGENKKAFETIKNDLDKDLQHVEGILNQVRLIRQITGGSEDKSFDEITGENAKELDKAICNKIYDVISSAEKEAELTVAKDVIGWLNWLARDFPKEIFTTNYDMILEKSFESLLIPFYDGFVGSHEPFFAHESLDGASNYDRPPVSWIRLWKLHGSLGWFWKQNKDNKTHRVIRLSSGAKDKYPESELVIYPSRDKYESSRKQPFVSYFDRLKEFLLNGEGIFIISGYSFSDEHINEVLFNGLNQNNRLQVIAFFFEDEPIEQIVKEDKNFPNFTMIGPKKCSISGINGEWSLSKKDDLIKPFWKDDELNLGDFKKLVEYLILCSGIKEEKKPKTSAKE